MYAVIKTIKKEHFDRLGLDPCLLEDELDKVCLVLPGLPFYIHFGSEMFGQYIHVNISLKAECQFIYLMKTSLGKL